MRVSLHPIEGLVLHQIGYLDGGRLRPILYRASLSEMVVPYGSTAMNHWWKNAFDAGDVAWARWPTRSTLGCDCLGEIVYLDAVAGRRGRRRPRVPTPSACTKRTTACSGSTGTPANQAEVRRSRRMVVSSIPTVGNYEYGFFWYFYLDGTIQAEVKLTGIIQTQAVARASPVRYASPVDARTGRAAPPAPVQLPPRHVPSTARTTRSTRSTRSRPGRPGNPYGNAFAAQQTLLATESGRPRIAAPERARLAHRQPRRPATPAASPSRTS